MDIQYEDLNLSIIRNRLNETGSVLRFEGPDVSPKVLEIVANYLLETRDNYVVKSTMIGHGGGSAGYTLEVSIESKNIELRIKWSSTKNDIIEIRIISVKGGFWYYHWSEIEDGDIVYIETHGVSVPIYKKPMRPICVPARFTHSSFRHMNDPRVLNMILKLKRNYTSTYHIPYTVEGGVSLEELNIWGKPLRSAFYRYEIGKFDVERCCINEVTYCMRVFPELTTIDYSYLAGEECNNLYYIFDAKMKLKEIRYSAWNAIRPYGYNIYVKDEKNIVVEKLNREADVEQIEFAFGRRPLPYMFEYV